MMSAMRHRLEVGVVILGISNSFSPRMSTIVPKMSTTAPLLAVFEDDTNFQSKVSRQRLQSKISFGVAKKMETVTVSAVHHRPKCSPILFLFGQLWSNTSSSFSSSWITCPIISINSKVLYSMAKQIGEFTWEVGWFFSSLFHGKANRGICMESIQHENKGIERIRLSAVRRLTKELEELERWVQCSVSRYPSFGISESLSFLPYQFESQIFLLDPKKEVYKRRIYKKWVQCDGKHRARAYHHVKSGWRFEHLDWKKKKVNRIIYKKIVISFYNFFPLFLSWVSSLLGLRDECSAPSVCNAFRIPSSSRSFFWKSTKKTRTNQHQALCEVKRDKVQWLFF